MYKTTTTFFVVFSLFSDHAHAREIAKVAAMVIDETYRFKGGVFLLTILAFYIRSTNISMR